MAVVKRGDTWLAALDPTLGGEIRKTRPCIVVSPAEMHGYLRTATVVPITTVSHAAPFRIPIRFQGKSGPALLDQIRTLDKRRLIKRLGAARAPTLGAILST
jgi:mRNA interferase MazF